MFERKKNIFQLIMFVFQYKILPFPTANIKLLSRYSILQVWNVFMFIQKLQDFCLIIMKYSSI